MQATEWVGRTSVRRLIAFVCVVTLVCTSVQFFPVKANGDSAVQVYEAEQAEFSDTLFVASDVPGYSGTGYVGRFEQNSDYIHFDIEVAEAGLYDLVVGYGAIFGGGKVIDIKVNGSLIGNVSIGQSGFGEVSAGKILLNQGTNQVTISPNWTWLAIDYIKISPAPAPEPHQAAKQLINPNATQATKALHSYLIDHFGTNILSGQQEYPNAPLQETQYVYENTGKYPAILGLDFMDNSPSRVERGTSADEVPGAIDWVNNRGGIVTLMWHWNAPKGLIDEPGKEWWRGFYTDATTFDLAYAMSHPESEDYQLLIRDIDVIAEELKRLQDAGVPVLWRPLHEAEGGWFWWGAKGPQPAIELWKLMYDRMTNHHQLNNLIWVWNSKSKDWYPGDEYVDVASFDSYPGSYNYSPMSAQYNELVELSSNKKLIAMTENGPIPDPDLLQIYHANYSWFVSWNGAVRSDNSIEHLNKVYHHDYVITLDELPSLQTYLVDSCIEELTERIEVYTTTGELSGPLAVQVSNSFRQVRHHYENGRYYQAVNHLDNITKQLEKSASKGDAEPTMVQDLQSAVNELTIAIIE